jgi:hypothetical protein
MPSHRKDAVGGRAATELRAALGPGETLAWLGAPRPLLYAWIQGRLVCAAGLALVAAALVWPPIWHGLERTPALFVDTGQTILLALGALAALSPLGHYAKARGLAYGLSSSRAIVAATFPSRSIQSFEPGQLGGLKVVEHGGGTGSLVFERVVVVNDDGVQSIVKRGFFALDDARDVHRVLRETLGIKG